MRPPARINQQRAEQHMEDIHERYEVAYDTLRYRRPALIQRMAFLRGMHYGFQTWDGGWIQAGPDEIEHEIHNMIRPIVRASVADRVKTFLNGSAVPAGPDPRSQLRAQASEGLMKAFARGEQFHFDEIYRACTASAVHGASWFKTMWDPTAGRVYSVQRPVDPEDPDTFADEKEEEEQRARVEHEYEGDIRTTYVSVLEALPSAWARTEREVDHMFHVRPIPARLLNDWFPTDIFNKPTRDQWTRSADQTDENSHRHVEDRAMAAQIRGSGAASPLCELKEYWERPSTSYPRGRFILYSGEIILYLGPLPHEWPWDLLQGPNIVPGALYADGIVQDLISPQRTLNEAESRRKEFVGVATAPHILIPHGARVDKNQFDDVAGRFIDYAQGKKPEWTNPPPEPRFDAYIADTVNQMKNVSTHADVDSQQGLDSARAMAYYDDQKAGVFAGERASFNKTCAAVLSKQLRLARDFYPDGRLIHILGTNNRPAADAFRADEYDFNTRMVIEPFDPGPSSRALRRTERLELFSAGAYDDTPAAQKFRREMGVDVVGSETMGDEDRLHRRRCLAEQAALLEGRVEQIQVFEEDDHEVHLQLDRTFRISEEFLGLPEQLQQMYLAHMAEHQELHSLQFADYQSQQGMVPGQGGAAAPAAPQGLPPADGGHGMVGQGEALLPHETQPAQIGVAEAEAAALSPDGLPPPE